MKIAFLQIHEAPYRMDFLRHLAHQPGIDLTVFSYLGEDPAHGYWRLPRGGSESRKDEGGRTMDEAGGPSLSQALSRALSKKEQEEASEAENTGGRRAAEPRAAAEACRPPGNDGGQEAGNVEQGADIRTPSLSRALSKKAQEEASAAENTGGRRAAAEACRPPEAEPGACQASHEILPSDLRPLGGRNDGFGAERPGSAPAASERDEDEGDGAREGAAYDKACDKAYDKGGNKGYPGTATRDGYALGYRSLTLGPHIRLGPSLLHWRMLHPRFLREFDVVAVTAHSHMTSLLAYFWCRVWKIPYVYMADTVDERLTSRPIRALKAAIYRRAAFLFVPGKASMRFFRERYGIPAERMLAGYYSFDYDKIRQWASEGRQERRAARRRLGIPEEAPLSIMAANFLPFRKHLELIKEFETRPGEHLLLVGEGECLAECRDYVAARGLEGRVHFVPGLPFEELVRLLPVGDSYVHSGREPYSTMPLLARLAGLELGIHGEIPALEDLGVGGVAAPGAANDAPLVAARFVIATTKWSQRRE